MLRVPSDPLVFRSYFGRQILLPICALATIVVLAATFGLYAVTKEANTAATLRQSEVVGHALASTGDRLGFEQEGIATWEQLSQHLSGSPADVQWLDKEIGVWAVDGVGYDMTFILDRANRPIFAYLKGPASPATYAPVAPELGRLVAAMRGRDEGDSNRSNPAAPAPVEGPVSDVVEIDGKPAAASVVGIGPRGTGRGDTGPLLVSVKFIDQTMLQDIGGQILIEGLRYGDSPEAAPDESMFELKDKLGNPIGHFFFKPFRPGTRIMQVVGPAAAIVILLLLGAMALLVRLLWGSGQRLAATMVDLQASEAQAQHLAFHDVLTGLPNRALFNDRLDQALARARRGDPCAVLALDLDRFKQVNDTLGHAAGDALIREFATRLNAVVRDYDTVARLGGDEFVILLPDVASRDEIELFCERILTTVHEPFELLGTQAFVGVSIGVVLAPDAGVDRGDVVRKADIALYRAKHEGRDCYRLFTPAMDASVKLRGEIEEDLRRAIASGDQIHVYYQPEVGGDGNNIVGFEALLRWEHPSRGTIKPDQFIPIAEETGLISQLCDLVLVDACRLARKWPDHFFAVNLSAGQVRSPGLAERIIAIVEHAGCDPRQIELEITETVLLQDDDSTRATLRQLREVGFRIALDDFGTGYSSLSHLREFKVDKIKIDRTFTRNLGQDGEAAAIVASVVTLGHAMGLTVTAEGVETRGQMHLLSAAGCNELQGFLFSRAVPADSIADLLEQEAKLRDVA